MSSEEVASITTLLKDGKSLREVAKRLGYGKRTVQKYRRTTINEVEEQKPGRPQKLTSRDKRAIARLMLNCSAKTAAEMTKLINSEREYKISPQIIRRALKDGGLRAFKRKKKPSLSKSYRNARLKWALEHKDWPIEDWKRVFWSDKTRINRINSDGIKYYWETIFHDLGSAAVETPEFGGGTLII